MSCEAHSVTDLYTVEFFFFGSTEQTPELQQCSLCRYIKHSSHRAPYHGKEYLDDGKDDDPAGQAEGAAGVGLVAVTGVLVDIVHGLASCDTVDNVQPDHDNQLAGNDGPQTQPWSCNHRPTVSTQHD